MTRPSTKRLHLIRSRTAINHYNDVIMGAMVSQITSIATVYSTVYSSADQRKYQSSASLAFVRGIDRWPVNSPHQSSGTRKIFPFDGVIMLFFARLCHKCDLRDGTSEDFIRFEYTSSLNSLRSDDAYMHQWTGSPLDQIAACCLFGAKTIIAANAYILTIRA